MKRSSSDFLFFYDWLTIDWSKGEKVLLPNIVSRSVWLYKFIRFNYYYIILLLYIISFKLQWFAYVTEYFDVTYQRPVFSSVKQIADIRMYLFEK